MAHDAKVARATIRVLKEMADDEDVADSVLEALDYGMHDEWDCGLADGLAIFGPAEFQLAARSALGRETYFLTEANEREDNDNEEKD